MWSVGPFCPIHLPSRTKVKGIHDVCAFDSCALLIVAPSSVVESLMCSFIDFMKLGHTVPKTLARTKHNKTTICNMLEVKIKKHMSVCKIPSKLQVSFPRTEKQSILDVCAGPWASEKYEKRFRNTVFWGQNSQRQTEKCLIMNDSCLTHTQLAERRTAKSCRFRDPKTIVVSGSMASNQFRVPIGPTLNH